MPTETIVRVDAADRREIEEVYRDDQGREYGRGYRVEWKDASPEGRLRLAIERTQAIRTRMQEVRTGWNDNSMTAAQQRRASADTADAVNDLARIVLYLLRLQRGDDSPDIGA